MSRDEFIVGNLPLVTFVITKYFQNELARFDDLCSVGTIALINAVDTYDESKGAFSTYAVVVMRRAVARYIASGKSFVSLDEVEDISSEIDIEEEYCNKETVERVRRAISRLNDEQRRCIELKYFSHMTYREISDKLSIPLGNVHKNIAQGTRRIRKEIEKEGEQWRKSAQEDDRKRR